MIKCYLSGFSCGNTLSNPERDIFVEFCDMKSLSTFSFEPKNDITRDKSFRIIKL